MTLSWPYVPKPTLWPSADSMCKKPTLWPSADPMCLSTNSSMRKSWCETGLKLPLKPHSPPPLFPSSSTLVKKSHLQLAPNPSEDNRLCLDARSSFVRNTFITKGNCNVSSPEKLVSYDTSAPKNGTCFKKRKCVTIFLVFYPYLFHDLNHFASFSHSFLFNGPLPSLPV